MNQQRDWTTLMGNPGRTGWVDAVFAPPLRVAWTYPCARYVWERAAITEHTVYLPGPVLVAFDRFTGTVQWHSEPVVATGKVAPTVLDDSVIVGGRKGIFILDKLNGRTLHCIQARVINAAVCVTDSVIAWPSGDSIFAVERSTHRPLWRYQHNFQTNFTCTAGTNCIYGATSRSVFALNDQTGELVWSYQVTGEATIRCETAALYETTLYITAGKGGLLALDAQTGTLKWSALGVLATSAVCVTTDTVYITGDDLFALHPETRALLWTTATQQKRYAFGGSVPICVGDHLYIAGGLERALLCFSRYTGQELWLFETSDLMWSTPAYAHGTLVVGGHDGNLYCFTT